MRLLEHLLTLHAFIVMTGLTIYVVSSRSLRLRRHPSAAIAWVIALVLMPYLALPLYLIFGIRKVNIDRPTDKPHALASRSSHPNTLAAQTQQLAAIMALPDASSYHELNIHQDGTQALHALRNMINAATHSIDLCTFILARDTLGDEVVAHLKRRAREGIKIRLLLDGVGVLLGGRHDFKKLSAEGIQVVLFVPPFYSPLQGRTNLRNHRKMLIVDNTALWCGGRNLAAEYFEGDANHAKMRPWTDLSFDLQGPLALQAQELFEQDWEFASQRTLRHQHTPMSPNLPDVPLAQLIASGPDQADDTIYTLLISSCFYARKSILAVTPYFVPDPTLLMSLTLAARRGVTVDLLLPKKSNHRLADMARHRSLRELTAAGAHVWFLPRMIHAKAIVIDTELALVGSANLDERSLFLNYELMLAFYGETDVRRFGQWIENQLKAAAAYNVRTPGFWRETLEGLFLWLAFQL